MTGARSHENIMLSLGIEFSTQSVKLVVLDLDKKQVVYTGKFDYDKQFPSYKTTGGLVATSSPALRHTSPFMMIEAVDHVFEQLKKDKIDLSQIKVMKADGMQHCTIYNGPAFGPALAALAADKSLLDQLKGTVSRATAPIWEDRSTGDEAKLLTDLLKKHGGVEKLTGNRVELRFPAVQIMKWAKDAPAEYKATAHVSLLSAFLTSLLSGKVAPVDTGDGWGTNLNSLDINQPSWDKRIIDEVNGYLKGLGLPGDVEKKIGGITHYDEPVGKVSPYFVKKYGVAADAIVLAATGDNPATLLGCGGHIVLSLGSSYTVNGVMGKVEPSLNGEYNVFGYTKGTAMALSCMTNGGKLHEEFLRKYILKSADKPIGQAEWNAYRQAAGQPVLTENEKIMLPYLFDESVPRCKAGIIREGFDETSANDNVRALYVSQALALKLHSSHLSDIKSFCIVAGGSKDPFFRQIITDLFNAESFIIQNSDFAAPLGCAISGAKHALNVSYDQAADMFVIKDKTSALKPIPANVAAGKKLLERYKKLEDKHVQK
jgi:xylulokinase